MRGVCVYMCVFEWCMYACGDVHVWYVYVCLCGAVCMYMCAHLCERALYGVCVDMCGSVKVVCMYAMYVHLCRFACLCGVCVHFAGVVYVCGIYICVVYMFLW